MELSHSDSDHSIDTNKRKGNVVIMEKSAATPSLVIEEKPSSPTKSASTGKPHAVTSKSPKVNSPNNQLTKTKTVVHFPHISLFNP